jgi:hypothetical protein
LLNDGEDVEGFKQKDVTELRNEFTDEGGLFLKNQVDPQNKTLKTCDFSPINWN